MKYNIYVYYPVFPMVVANENASRNTFQEIFLERPEKNAVHWQLPWGKKRKYNIYNILPHFPHRNFNLFLFTEQQFPKIKKTILFI